MSQKLYPESTAVEIQEIHSFHKTKISFDSLVTDKFFFSSWLNSACRHFKVNGCYAMSVDFTIGSFFMIRYISLLTECRISFYSKFVGNAITEIFVEWAFVVYFWIFKIVLSWKLKRKQILLYLNCINFKLSRT